jgi:hypothetical protein
MISSWTGLSAKSRTRSSRRGRVKTVSVGNRILKAAFPLTLAGVQVMTYAESEDERREWAS